jgi:hypothetical protein
MRAATLAALVVLGCSGSPSPETTAFSEAGSAGASHQRDATGGRSVATESTAGERSAGGKTTGGTGAGGSAEAGAAGAEAGQAGGSSTGGTEATGGTQPIGGIGSGVTSSTGGTHPTGGSHSGGIKATGGSSAGGTAPAGGTPTSGGTDAAGASGAEGQGTGGLVSTMPGVWGCDHELAVVCPTGCSLLGIDPRNCGECGNDITEHEGSRPGELFGICVDGVAVACPKPEVRCLTTCHDLRTDKQNCGECGNDCGHGRCFDWVCE